MSSYDPQRNRPRQRPGDDEPAPVDALLDAADAPPAHDHGHHHHNHRDHGHRDHGHHDHDHDHGDDEGSDVALVPLVLVVGAVGGVLLLWRTWRRHHTGR